MDISINNQFKLLVSLSLVFIFSQIIFASEDWRPISKDELAMDKGEVEKDADAEAIFWEVKVADDLSRTAGYKSVLEHYIRIKIFTERGRENHSTVHIPYSKLSDGARVSISDISARTTKLNGTQILLDKKDIFEQEIVKGEGIKIKGKSFVVPGIEKGAIIEYRWKEIRRDTFSYFVRLNLSRNIPIKKVKYYVKPISNPRFGLAMRIQTFGANPDLVKEDGGYYSMSKFYARSYIEEPYMPPELSVRPWLLVYYANQKEDTNISTEKYWKNKAVQTYELHKSIYKKRKEISLATQQAIGEETDSLEKVRKIFSFCRTNIKNVNDDALNLTPTQRKKIKENKSEKDTLKNGQGTGHDINMLFASMVNAAGLKVRIANVTLRSNPEFKKNLLNDYFLNAETVAVQINNKWQFFDPSLQHLPFGLQSWAEEGQTVLVSDKKELIWKSIAKSNPEQSNQKRIIKVKLDEEGTIEGDVRIEYTGHLARFRKENFDEETPDEIEKAIIKLIKEQISKTTEVTDVSFENITDPEKPLVYKFKIRSPNFAEKTGKRMFVRPNIFAKNSTPRFTTNTRKNDIFFNYPWSEEDSVSIETPTGYALETADAPDKVTDTGNLGLHNSFIKFDSSTRMLTYKREFMFGKGGVLEFDSNRYRILKRLFDTYHKADQHTLTFNDLSFILQN